MRNLPPLAFFLVALLSSASVVSVAQDSDGTLPTLQVARFGELPVAPGGGGLQLGPQDLLTFAPVVEASMATHQTVSIVGGVRYRQVPVQFGGLNQPASSWFVEPADAPGYGLRAYVRPVLNIATRTTFPATGTRSLFVAEGAPAGDYLLCVYRSTAGPVGCTGGLFVIRWGG